MISVACGWALYSIESTDWPRSWFRTTPLKVITVPAASCPACADSAAASNGFSVTSANTTCVVIWSSWFAGLGSAAREGRQHVDGRRASREHGMTGRGLAVQ